MAAGREVTRREKLHDLARRELGADEPDLDNVVWELAALFNAAACTALLEEEATGTLRLSASTDTSLGSEKHVVYELGQGLTGWVFACGESLRLSRANDQQLVREVTGLERDGPRFLEHDPEGRAATQFLGVPIRAAVKVIGVLRMSRLADAPRFTAEDAKAIQFFADLLGIALKRTWRLLVSRTIEESASIAIAISRREPQPDGTHVPWLIYANPGALQMLGYSGEPMARLDARCLYAPGAYEALYTQLEAKLDQAVEVGRSELGPVDSMLLHKSGDLLPVKISY